MKTNEYMEQTEQYVLHTYNRFPLVIDHGEGVHLYDTDGKAYLDFAAGIAVYALGYSNDDYKKAVKDQVDKNSRTNSFVRKDLKQQAVRDSSVHDVDSRYAVLDRINAALQFWNHAAADISVCDEISCFLYVELGNQALRILRIFVDTLDIGQECQFFCI